MASIASVKPASASAATSATTTSPSGLGKGIRLAVFYLLLLVILLVFITPYLFSAFAAFKTLPDILAQSPARPPMNPTLDNFKTIFTQDNFGRYLLNTLLVTVILTTGQVIFSMMGAYAFARMEFPGRDGLFWMYLATLMVPNVVTLVPLYVMFAHSGLLNTYWAIFLPYVLGVPQAVFLMRQYFMTIPKEVMEAARLDGCSESRILVPEAGVGTRTMARLGAVASHPRPGRLRLASHPQPRPALPAVLGEERNRHVGIPDRGAREGRQLPGQPRRRRRADRGGERSRPGLAWHPVGELRTEDRPDRRGLHTENQLISRQGGSVSDRRR